MNKILDTSNIVIVFLALICVASSSFAFGDWRIMLGFVVILQFVQVLLSWDSNRVNRAVYRALFTEGDVHPELAGLIQMLRNRIEEITHG